MRIVKLSALTLSFVSILSLATNVTTIVAQEGKEYMLTSVTGGKDEADAKAFEAELEKLTGLDIIIEKPANDYGTVLLQKLAAGGEGLDLVYFNQDQLSDLVEQGALLDITDLIGASEILSDTSIIPDTEWNNIALDERIYAGFNKKEVHRLVNLNQAMLKQYEVSPLAEESLEGYYKLFMEMKEKVTDLDGFYPFNTVLSTLNDLQPFFAELDLKMGVVVDENGKRSVPISTEAAAPVWEWLQTLYAENLLDPSSLTDTTKELREKFQSSRTGVIVDWAAWTGLYNSNNVELYPEGFEAVPLGGTKTSDGGYMLARGAASLWGIPASSDNVEGAIKVLETFATQEGGILLSLGSEGHDYTVEDGEYALTEIGEAHGKDHGAPFPITALFETPLPHNPGVEEAMEYLKFASTETFLPESAVYNEIVAQSAIRIVKGDISVEEGLIEMQANLKDAGVVD